MKFTQYAAPLLAAASVVTAFPAAKRNVTASEKKYIILDNDWSSAGFIPFLIALDAGYEVLGLASDTANTWQHQVALHGLATLEVGNLSSCIPVVPGSTYPLLNTANKFQAWEAVHGDLAWQGAFAPYNATAEALGSDPTSGDDPNRVVKGAFLEGFPSETLIQGLEDSQSAAAFMVEMVHRYPGQVSIYSGGALTNVALAVRMDEKFASLTKNLVLMGGYIDVNLLQVTGSVNQNDINSDINLMIDPEAAKIAFTADFPDIIFAGNVANQVISSQEFLDEVYEVKNAYSELMYNNYGTIFPFWDETAAAILVDPTIITNSTTFYVDVDIAYGSPSYGNIHAYQSALMPPGLRNVTYVNSIDSAKLKTMIKRSVQYPRNCSTMGMTL
ncbi:inosine-uridine preferring nucleoside hydrolase-like protein [Coleophoma crateriformis]|uniref:Inosine-uridine preferring nucleoside hydrolase-like protein n=1 Tax=Coleophoma crateriformis TaxID=565419 RepID=A0A3D8QRV3_9HELO|nr:inosine-uridine preferring nucleoside hydrolase-like protein [Coleophoma crateriformis]